MTFFSIRVSADTAAGTSRHTKSPELSPRGAVGLLHEGIRYEEHGPAVSQEAKKVRARKMIRELRSLGYSGRTSLGRIGQPDMIFDLGSFVPPERLRPNPGCPGTV